MSGCLPDLPPYVRERGGEWQVADHPDGPWRPIPAPQSGLPWNTDGPAVQSSREPASVVAEGRHLSPAAQVVMLSYAAVRCRQEWSNVNDPPCHPEDSNWDGCKDCRNGPGVAAAFRAAAAQMIKTGDLTDTAEDIIRGAERHHQAGWLCTMAAEMEGANG